MFKKLIALILTVQMSFASAACGNASQQGGTTDASVSKQTADLSESTQNAAEEKEKENGDSGVAKTEGNKMQTASYTIGGVDFNMILVESGTFTMGSNNANVAFNESPAHQVTLTQDYLIGETEVTEALWNVVMGKSGGSPTLPKTSVTWQQCSDFTKTLTKLAREQGIIDNTVRFTLPTEAQWEFAAKGGNLSKGYLYSGGDNIDDVAVTRENSGSDSPINVKTKRPNELGIYDMSGNAYEWVEAYAGDYTVDAQTDPVSHPDGKYVKRGGSNYHNFSSESYLFTTTGRYFYGSTDWTIGFRLALVYDN